MTGKTKVILMDRIGGLGRLGDEVEVNAGYARNWLIPQRQAVPATPAMRAEFEQQRKELELQQAERLNAAQAQAEQLKDITLSLPVSAGLNGKMFGSVRARDLAEALLSAGVQVDKSRILLSGAIRELGQHSFIVHLHPEVRVQMSVSVQASGASAPESTAGEPEDASEDSADGAEAEPGVGG